MPQEIMDFPSAIQKVIQGHKITKLEWQDPKVFVFIHDGFLRINKVDGTIPQLLVSEADLVGTDWIVVGE